MTSRGSSLLKSILHRFIPGAAKRHRAAAGSASKKRRCRGAGARSLTLPEDVEAVCPKKRNFMHDAMHRADDVSEDEESGEHDPILRDDTLAEVNEYMQKRQEMMTQEQVAQEKAQQVEAVRSICKTRTGSEMLTCMDTLIQDEWLGGLDALPGNIYGVMALDFKVSWKPLDMIKKMSFLVIMVIQLIGPPLIFFQFFTAKGIERHEQMHWDRFTFSTSDWHDPDNGEWTGTTKLIATLFVLLFCLNGLFCHIEEYNAWKKVDRLYNFLNVNGTLESGTCHSMTHIGAFVNTWVIVWLALDTYVVLGTSDNVAEVLLDALGLTFLYNLDDISGDLGLVDQDDWPGTQLAFVDAHIRDSALAYDDVEETGTSPIMSCWLSIITMVLTVLCVALPLLSIYTPFKTIKPDPYFQNLVNEADMEAILRKIVANMTEAAIMPTMAPAALAGALAPARLLGEM